jgi:MFS family permease
MLGTSGTMLGMLALVITDDVPLFLVGVALLGAGGAFLGSAPAAVVGDVTGGRGGTVAATFQMASDVGSISGPLVAGRIADGAGFAPAFGAGAIVSGLGLLLATVIPETLPRRRRAPSPDAAPAVES